MNESNVQPQNETDEQELRLVVDMDYDSAFKRHLNTILSCRCICMFLLLTLLTALFIIQIESSNYKILLFIELQYDFLLYG